MKRFSTRFWLRASLILLPLTVAAHAQPGHLLAADSLFLAALPFGIALGAFHTRFARHWKTIPAASPSWRNQLYFGFFNSILATVMVSILLRGANIYFDKSPPRTLRLTVLHQHIGSRNRGAASVLSLIVANPLQSGHRVAIPVSDHFYIAHPQGSSFGARLRRGLLGAAWIEPLE